MASKARRLDWLEPAIVTGTLVPVALILFRALTGRLGANPIATAMNQLGLLALVLLLACLACTPLKLVTGYKWPIRLRKTLGLCAFFAALAHFLVYLVLDQVLMLDQVLADILKRPFIAFGLSALVAMVPLALTSTNRALQRMGPKRWKRLHRLVYLAGALAVVHYLLRVKQDLSEPAIYAAVLAALLAMRLVKLWLDRRRAPVKG
jgi:sulfoxide reductase heme-binding subunit YedZ